MDHSVRSALLQRHVQGLEHKFGPKVRAHRPPHDPAAPDIQHDGQVQEASPSRYVGDVSDPELVRPRRVELPVHEISGWRVFLAPPRGPDTPAPADSLNAGGPHDPGHPVQAGQDPAVGKFSVHPRRPIRSVALLVDRFDGPEKGRVRLRSLGWTPAQPRVVTAP